MAHSRLRTRYEDHGVWGLVDQVSESLRAAELSPDDEPEADNVEILETSIATLKLHSTYSSPVITTAMLDDLQSHLTTVNLRLAE